MKIKGSLKKKKVSDDKKQSTYIIEEFTVTSRLILQKFEQNSETYWTKEVPVRQDKRNSRGCTTSKRDSDHRNRQIETDSINSYSSAQLKYRSIISKGGTKIYS